MGSSLQVAEAVLRRYFGHEKFRPGQADVVAAVLAGRDTIGVLPTGGGKSLCYQVPALVRDGLTVVISPLISLMKDQVDRLVGRGIAAAFLNSAVSRAESARILSGATRGVLRLLYVAPERFESEELTRTLARSRVTLVAVDEAHCISEWGHEFRPSFRRIAAVSERLGTPQIVALTATATPRVRADIGRQLRLRDPRVIVGGFDRPNLSYAVRSCRNETERLKALMGSVRAVPPPVVAYAPTRSSVERLARQLRRHGLKAAAYHGGLDDEARRDAQEAFMRESVHVIVATNAFGMGIDKPNVRLVVHHTMPGTLEAYYQEAGRAGRDGGRAQCLLLQAPGDRAIHDWFIRTTFPAPDVVRTVHALLRRSAEGGRVHADGPAVAARLPALPAREVDGALRLLERHGALTRDDAQSSLHVRLQATPARIARELAPGGIEARLIRAWWPDPESPRDVRFRPGNPPPGLSGVDVRDALRSLRSRQFLDYWPGEGRWRLADQAPDALVDWAHLERRRRAEVAKLEAMVDYVRTTECRRAFVLSYFGQGSRPGTCSGCDNCLGR